MKEKQHPLPPEVSSDPAAQEPAQAYGLQSLWEGCTCLLPLPEAPGSTQAPYFICAGEATFQQTGLSQVLDTPC